MPPNRRRTCVVCGKHWYPQGQMHFCPTFEQRNEKCLIDALGIEKRERNRKKHRIYAEKYREELRIKSLLRYRKQNIHEKKNRIIKKIKKNGEKKKINEIGAYYVN
jgi:hypothetical protein